MEKIIKNGNYKTRLYRHLLKIQEVASRGEVYKIEKKCRQTMLVWPYRAHSPRKPPESVPCPCWDVLDLTQLNNLGPNTW